METLVTQPYTVLSYQMETTLQDVMLIKVREKTEEMYTAAQSAGLSIIGPLQWNYYGADGNPATMFTLEIALPIVPTDQHVSGFEVKQLPAFKYVKTMLEGSWGGMGDAYGKLIPTALQAGLQLQGVSREIYHKIDHTPAENHLTEIQVGVL